MADKSVFHKNTLGQLATPKKSATVETAFDSDESDWSDDGGQLNAAVKQPVQPVPAQGRRDVVGALDHRADPGDPGGADPAVRQADQVQPEHAADPAQGQGAAEEVRPRP